MLPAVKVHTKERGDFQPGLDVLEQVVRKRGDWERVRAPQEAVEQALAGPAGSFAVPVLVP